ncbi:MAG: hypothetical protein L0Y58_03530 [Verrucomicrobia subdivision 3 bacterium]|nr:hypothetical protein [Limisphaerales bacterium]
MKVFLVGSIATLVTGAHDPRILSWNRMMTQMTLHKSFIALWLSTFCCPFAIKAWEPVKLSPYPQKVRAFFSISDTNVPAALRTNGTPLPVGGITAIARANDSAMWLGTTQGLMRLDFSAPERDRRQYMAGLRYLPDDRVQQIEPDAQGGVWVRTSTGVSHIELKPMTLAQKAQVFEQRVRTRHDRYGLTAPSHLTVAGDVSSNRTHDNDNDGLWTAIYAAAECFRYAVTQSAEALANARKSVDTILFLEEVAGRRGFPARSFIRKGDPMPHGGEWHWTADGQYYWKADTSSDEVVGHFFIFSVAHDLLPDADLKKRIAATAQRVMDHIIDHGYYLIDLDGKPTLWGFWSPESLRNNPDERALNSMQLLSFLKTTAHITGDARYEREYKKVAWDLKYADWLTRVNDRLELNYSDEELAMLPYYCLFKYEKDPVLLKAYRAGVDGWWKNMQRELNPLWTFIYLTGQPEAKVDLAGAVWTLYRMPMDMIEWTVRNSHCADIVWAATPDRRGHREALTLLPPDERRVMKWNSNPFIVDGGNGGRGEDDGAAFLLPYWMGRYRKFMIGE